ncbi:hypothetical protein BBJ28_00018003 [Nothophytophthora sp. Chile5]|nr:hypothetical protein BBJ28_00018003 [Nothophytophthora sp. Chile5]
MLSSSVDREDVGISRDCAQTLAALAQLPTTKTKLLQAPGGIDCVFSLLHAPSDHKLRLAGFEVVAQLVATDDWREAVAKREGFVLMLSCCAGGGALRSARGGGGGDTRIRSLAAAVLHQLALSRTNRQLFYHSGYFTALAGLLRDPFLDKDAVFRRELLSFIHLLLSEEENARRFTSLGLLPCVLAVLLGHSSSCASGLSHPVSLLVVAILEAVANDSANHEALVQAEALPRLVQLCFCPTTGMAVVGPGSGRPRTAAATGRRQPSQPKAPPVRPASATASAAHRRPPSASELLVSETSALVRVVLGIFCAMARNLANREPVIRSKVLDHIASRELYASPDKRVRRAVITLLTLLICFEREKRPTTDQTSGQLDADAAGSSLHRPSCEPPDTSQSNHQHYIELLARGVVKCLFGILAGDDFSMKVDALAALAQLTQDTPSRLTLCKPALLLALQQFAFHPLATTRLHVAQIIANFAERPENVLKLVDAGLLAVLVRYVSRQGPGLRPSHSSDKATGDALLLETTRALAAVSMLHVARTRLVESGVLGSLLRLIRAPTSRAEVRSHALAVVCNLRHDAAALRIQAVFRGWHVRATQGSHLGCSRRTQPHRMLLILGQAAVASDTRPTTLRQQR